MLQLDINDQLPGFQCEHIDSGKHGTLAVVNITGEKSTVFDELPKCHVKGACCFNLNEIDNSFEKLLENHKAVLILDSTHNGKAPGTISLADLGAQIKKKTSMSLSSKHGQSLLDELRDLHAKQSMPQRIVLLAVETDDYPLTHTSIKNLSQLICKAAEALKRECKT